MIRPQKVLCIYGLSLRINLSKIIDFSDFTSPTPEEQPHFQDLEQVQSDKRV